MTRRLRSALVSRAIVLALAFVSTPPAYAKLEERGALHQKVAFDVKFFAELHRIFGRFRDADLERVFDAAEPLKCADLASDKGEWREVAFFNEYRELGNWYRTSLYEVKGDPSVYIFQGSCAGQRSPVQLTTKFPVEASFKEYENGKIRFKDIHLIANPAVMAHFDSETATYMFDLPYVFRISGRHAVALYALRAPTLAAHYDPDVTNRWACKSVTGADVVYQFVICRTNLVARYRERGRRSLGDFLGTAAFSILSDGREASSSVRLTFSGGGPAAPHADRVSAEDRGSSPQP